ncbi:MAG: cysteine desulfurase family protein [Bdellovibrionales bacterium]
MRLSTIYFDDQATTPVDPRVREAMAPCFCEAFGNPASRTHAYGWQAEMAVNKARAQVANLINAKPEHIIFTSGATESNNLALMGTLEGVGKPAHVIVSAVEHKAILEVAEAAALRGFTCTVLPVNEYGQVTLDQIEKAIRPETKLISIMWANNEIGSINPIAQIGALAKKHNIFFHTDAAQAASRVPIDVESMNIDLLSMSGHKMYGPKGVGALFVRRHIVPLKPIMFGGAQEWGLRPGTLNVPGIVGLGSACEIAKSEGLSESTRLRQWRDTLVNLILKEVPGSRLNGHPTERLCSNVSFSFKGLKSDLFTLGLGGLACSSGSACTSATGSSSHVLKAIGLSEDLARATLRLGFGRFTTASEISSLTQKILALR